MFSQSFNKIKYCILSFNEIEILIGGIKKEIDVSFTYAHFFLYCLTICLSYDLWMNSDNNKKKYKAWERGYALYQIHYETPHLYI